MRFGQSHTYGVYEIYSRVKAMSTTLAALHNIKYADTRLYKSDLLKEAVENHLWFIRNSSGRLNAVFKDINTSIDLIMDQLKDDTQKINLIAAKMFEVLEQKSLFYSCRIFGKKAFGRPELQLLKPRF